MTYIYLKLKMMFRSPLMMGLLILSLVIGMVSGFIIDTYESREGTYSIGLVDLDKSERSSALIKALEDHASLIVTVYPDKEQATEALSNKDILQSYVLLEGFEDAIFSGKYNHIIEVVSMIKNPYSPWLNDQVSVGVIREWIISDGYQRMLSVDPSYVRTDFARAFNAYDGENELLSFTVIELEELVRVEEKALPLYVQGVLWAWSGLLLLLSVVMMRMLYNEKRRHINQRLSLAGVGLWQYHGTNVGFIVMATMVITLLFLMTFKLSTGQVDAIDYNLIVASLALSICFYATVCLLNRIPLNFNQLLLIYLGVFMCWSLATIDAIGFLDIGKVFQNMSPLTLFFNICA